MAGSNFKDIIIYFILAVIYLLHWAYKSKPKHAMITLFIVEYFYNK